MVTGAAEQARDEAGFFGCLRQAGVLVRVRFSQINPGQVTGYSVGLPGHLDGGGAPRWYGGGRLSAGLTLPRLRYGWDRSRSTGAGSSGAFRFTAPERDAIFEHAARQAAAAADHIRCSVRSDPAGAADAAWAAGDTLHIAARALRNPELRRAADAYDRAARARYGQIPRRTQEGSQLRTAARLIALTGRIATDATLAQVALIANLAALAIAVAELRQAEQHAAQATAARAAASHLHAASVQAHPPAPSADQAQARRPGRPTNAADAARSDFPVPVRPDRPAPAGSRQVGPHPPGGPQRPRRAGSSR